MQALVFGFVFFFWALLYWKGKRKLGSKRRSPNQAWRLLLLLAQSQKSTPPFFYWYSSFRFGWAWVSCLPQKWWFQYIIYLRHDFSSTPSTSYRPPTNVQRPGSELCAVSTASYDTMTRNVSEVDSHARPFNLHVCFGFLFLLCI